MNSKAVKFLILISWVIFFWSWATGPGVRDFFSLRKLHQDRLSQLAQLQIQIRSLEKKSKLLLSNKEYQEYEIRRILGHVASDEIVFDFSDKKTQ